jgi:hypothetical protein
MGWSGSLFSRHPEEDRRYKEFVRRAQAAAEEESRRLAQTPIRDYLRDLNRPDAYRRDATIYVDLAGLGGIGEHGGAEMLTTWYARNIRIFSNLCGVTAAGDRIFVLFGSGHIPILRELVELSSRHRLVDAADFL